MILGPSLAQISPLWRPEPPTAYHSLNIQIKFHGFHSEMSHPTEVSQVFLSLDMSWPTRAPEPLSGLERAIVHRLGTHGSSHPCRSHGGLTSGDRSRSAQGCKAFRRIACKTQQCAPTILGQL